MKEGIPIFFLNSLVSQMVYKYIGGVRGRFDEIESIEHAGGCLGVNIPSASSSSRFFNFGRRSDVFPVLPFQDPEPSDLWGSGCAVNVKSALTLAYPISPMRGRHATKWIDALSFLLITSLIRFVCEGA